MRHIKPSSMGVSLVVILPLLWKGITSQVIYDPEYSIQVSPSVSVQEGLCVTIPCTFTAENRNTFSNSTGYWKQSDYIVATNNKSSHVRRTNFYLTGNPDTGDCTLTITDAGKEDEGRYYYRFEESKDSKVKWNYNAKENLMTITVPDLTEEPVISDLGTLTADIEKTVTCAPPGNCSTTSLVFQWKKSDVSGIWKNSPTITFTPSPDDHQKTITCEMTNSKGKTTQKTIVLDVCYLSEEPVISDPGTLTAGIEKTVTCTALGNCSVTSLVFQWKKSDVSGIWKNSSTITFTPSLDDHQKNITCEMTNSKGKTTQKTIVLDVCCPPSVTITWEIIGKRNTLDSIRVGEGSSVTLRCSVQSDLTLNVTWTDNNNNVLQHGTGKDLELILQNMTLNHTGTYTCSALNKYVMNSKNINITVQYPPRNMEITIHSSKGKERPVSPQVDIDQTETLTLVCRADGNPPVTVVWRGEDDTETSIMSNNGLSAEINVTSSMSDVFRCLAWNAQGLRERRFQVGTIHGPTAEQKTSDTISYRDIAIAFICGIGFTTLIILLYKCISRKIMSKRFIYVNEKGLSASAEPPIYVNFEKPEQEAEEGTENNVQEDSSGVTLDQDVLHYSTIAFTEKSSKVPSGQPETEYAEIKRK